MKENQEVDLGSVHIHPQVIADIVANVISEVEGLTLVDDDIWGKVQELIGMKKYSAITISLDKNNEVFIDVKVSIQFGLNISDLATQAQDMIREAIERTGDIELKDVSINVHGITRGEK